MISKETLKSVFLSRQLFDQLFEKM